MLANSNVVLLRLRALSELQQIPAAGLRGFPDGERTSAEEGQEVLTSGTKKAAQPSKAMVLAKKIL